MQTITKIVSSIFIFLLIAGAASYAAPHNSIGTTHTASTLAIAAQGSGGGGGGGSGGGVTTDEPFSNIARADRMEKSLIANQPVSYTFAAPELGIYKIDITGKENENDVMLRVELLNQRSQKIISPPPGNAYKYINVFLSTKRITGATIHFRVDNKNNIQNPDLLRWDGGTWRPLSAIETAKDSTFTYYKANTEGFSSFVIVGTDEAVLTPAATPEQIAKEQPVSSPQQTAIETTESETKPTEMSWLRIVAGIITVLVVAVLVVFLLWMKEITQWWRKRVTK